VTEPISLDQAKQQLRVDVTADDALIGELIVTARQYVEKYCSVSLVAGAVAMTFPSFEKLDRLTFAPVTAISEIRYLDASGVEQLLDAATYELLNIDADELRPMVRLAYAKSWPPIRAVADAVRVTATAGYATVPAPILGAMKLLIAHWYDNRELMAPAQTVAEIPHAVTWLLANHRR
jgi:uncharacterized phiE125 gp8 family phage protein